MSLGFAIPSATAVDVTEQFLADGTATHPYLGVSLGRLTPAIKQRLGVQADARALVIEVDPRWARGHRRAAARGRDHRAGRTAGDQR